MSKQSWTYEQYVAGYEYFRNLSQEKDKRIKKLEAALEKIGLTNSPKEHWEIAQKALKG